MTALASRRRGMRRFAMPSRRPGVPLMWRVFATNAVALLAATLALVLAPVSVPVAAAELAVLLCGLALLLGVNLVMLRLRFARSRTCSVVTTVARRCGGSALTLCAESSAAVRHE
jgi:hypothetical protein